MDTMDTEALRVLAVQVLEDRKAIDVCVLDLRGKTDIADYMIVASGNTPRQVKALADHLIQACKERGARPSGVEGQANADWVLVDLVDVLVHLMVPMLRDFYRLEELWDPAL